MRTFGILGLDAYPKIKSIVVCKYDMGEFSLMRLWNAAPIDEIPTGVRLYVERANIPTDYVGNPISWMIASDRLAGAIHALAGTDIQLFDAPLYEKVTDEKINGYRIINPTRRIECLLDAVPKTIITDNVLRLSSIPEDAHIFRIHEKPNAVIVSELFVDMLKKGGFEGYHIVPLLTIDA